MRKLLDAIDELDRCAAEDTSLVFKKVKQEKEIAEMELQRLKEHLINLEDQFKGLGYTETQKELIELGGLLKSWVFGNEFFKTRPR